VAQVVRRPDRYSGGLAGLADRGAQGIGTGVGEQACVGVTEAAVRQRRLNRLGQYRVQLDPERPAGLGRGRAQPNTSSRLVVVTDELSCRSR
jgi:hypothetical protein